MDTYEIVPVETVKTVISNRMSIRVLNLVFGTSIEVIASVVQDNGSVTQNYHLVIAGEEYAAWGSDDDYMVNLIANKIGVTLASSEENVTLNINENDTLNINENVIADA
jgi:hypothetical protein